MVRNLFGTIISGLIIAGLACAWWFAAGQDISVMGQQAFGLVKWVGHLFQPVVEWIMSFGSSGAQ